VDKVKLFNFKDILFLIAKRLVQSKKPCPDKQDKYVNEIISAKKMQKMISNVLKRRLVSESETIYLCYASIPTGDFSVQRGY